MPDWVRVIDFPRIEDVAASPLARVVLLVVGVARQKRSGFGAINIHCCCEKTYTKLSSLQWHTFYDFFIYDSTLGK